MAILQPGRKGRRLPSLRGRVVFAMRGGQIVARKWPRKRGKAKTAGQRDREEWFRQANILAKYAPARQQALSRCTMDYLPVRPFDALISAMAGRLWAVETDDRGTLYSMASRADVSKNLDVLSQEIGRLIVRGSTFWEPLDWGDLDQYLASQGADALPVWKDLPAPGGGNPSVLGFAAGTRIGQTSTRFYGWAGLHATEASVEIVSPRIMTVKSLAVAINRTPDAGGSLVVTFRKNGADTALTVTFAPGDLKKLDLINSVPLVQGDLFAVKAVSNLLGASTWVNVSAEAT